MPYIEQNKRPLIDAAVDTLVLAIGSPGELNYAITTLLLKIVGAPSYQKYNDVIGVLECVKLELYRRVVSIFEDGKKDVNGDCFR